MNTYPNGWFKLVGLSGVKVLCYRCEACGILYKDVPLNTAVLCCGQQKTFDKSLLERLTELVFGKDRGEPVLVDDKAVRVGDRVIVPVDC